MEKSPKSSQKNMTTYIVVGVVILLMGGGAFFFLSSKKETPKQVPSTDQTQNVKTVKPEDIGLTLEPRSDKKGIVMKITKLTGIKSIEYDVSYDAEVTEEGQTTTTPRGVVGSPIEVKSGDSEIKRDIDLGTCSRNVCKYDKVVSDVKFTIRINYTNGDIGSVEQKISL